MSDRLPSGLVVSALIRRVHDAGGAAMVLAKGDAHGGMVLVVTLEKGRNTGLLERGIGPDGAPALIATGPVPAGEARGDAEAATNYWQRRRQRDPDLWVVELDVPSAERFAAETILDD